MSNKFRRQKNEALSILRTANLRYPEDIDILGALLSINREVGDYSAALIYAQKLATLMPENPGLKKLVIELKNKGSR